ncbi:MAG: hypothetical protein H7123_03250 [Thermoleophilia bacterium]|nr:hypothetical protein [Thermoleophilia bacterium]
MRGREGTISEDNPEGAPGILGAIVDGSLMAPVGVSAGRLDAEFSQ